MAKDIKDFMEEHDCTVVHKKESDRWEIRVNLGDKIVGAKADSLDEAVQRTIDFLSEIAFRDEVVSKTKAA